MDEIAVCRQENEDIGRIRWERRRDAECRDGGSLKTSFSRETISEFWEHFGDARSEYILWPGNVAGMPGSFASLAMTESGRCGMESTLDIGRLKCSTAVAGRE